MLAGPKFGRLSQSSGERTSVLSIANHAQNVKSAARWFDFSSLPGGRIQIVKANIFNFR
jgi:hypothetical protein